MGASEVRFEEEQPTSVAINANADLVLGGEGITERGPIGVAKGPFTSFAEWQRVFGGYSLNSLDAAAAVQGFFENAGQDSGAQLYWTRIVHFGTVGDPTTKTSAAGTITIQTAASDPTSGSIESAAQPFDLANGLTLVIAIDGGSDQTFTFAATAASRTSGNGTFNIPNGATLTLTINGVALPTKTFSSGEFVDNTAATAAEVVASLNAHFAANDAGALATVDGSAVKITSNILGTSSGVNVTGGTANAGILAFTTGNVAGTGDAANIDLVTAAEVVAKLSTLTGAVASVVDGAVLIESSTTGGSSSVHVKSASTADGALGFDNAVHPGGAGAAVNTLKIDARYDGAYADAVEVVIGSASSGEADEFNLYVQVDGVVRERFINLSMDDASPRFVEKILNDEGSGSAYVVATDLDAGAVDMPEAGTHGPLAGGDDGLVGLVDSDYVGGETANGTTGLRCFDELDVDAMIAPGRATSATHNGIITYCEVTRGGRIFAILDPPANLSAAQMVDYVRNTAALYGSSEYAAIYWPRVKVTNPSAALYGEDAALTIPPSGHVAGIYARVDASKVGGAFEQPAGTDVGIPRNVIGFETNEVLKKSKRDIVFDANVNPISREKGTPIFVDGARNLKLTGNFPSVGQRRGIIFVKKRLEPGLAVMRHKNIRPKLYNQGKATTEGFLLDLARNHCFKYDDPRKAYFVDFGAALNPTSVQRTRTVYGRVGIATSEPAEYIVILLGPDNRELDKELAALAA